MKLLNKLSLKKTKRLPIFTGIVCLGLIVGIIFTLLHPTNAEAVWFNDAFHYRQKVTIGNTGSADSNKKVKFDIDTATLIAAGKMQSDCDDTRFTDNNGAELAYYLDTSGGACNTASTDYYVLVSTINAGNTDLYMYYGNPAAPSGSQSVQFSQSTFSPTSGPTTGTEEKGLAPVLYWKFDEGNSTSVYDSSANSNTGTLGASSATPTWQSEDMCISGKCLKFDNSDDYVTRTYASDTELDVGTNGFSVSAWAKHINNIDGADILIDRYSSGGYFLYMNSSGNYCFGIDDDTVSFPEDSACSTATYLDGKWHFVEGVKSGTASITLYVDGQQVAQDSSISATGSISASSPTLYIGSEGPSVNVWDGWIDEVKLFDYEKSAAQVKADFNARGSLNGNSSAVGNSNTEKLLSENLVAYWKMEETVADTCTGLLDTCDSSGYGNNMEWQNNAASGAGKFGRGMVLDGVNDEVRIGTLFSGASITKRWTITTWFKSNSDTQGYIFDTRDTDGFALYTDGVDTIKLYYSKNAHIKDITYAASITDTNWHHALMTRDEDNNISVYIDGKKLTATATTNDDISSQSDSIGAVHFGHRFSGSIYSFEGTLDEARVYNRAFSEADVSYIYDWAPEPTVHWKLDENTGTSVSDASTTANTGTWHGSGSHWAPGKYGSGGNFDGTSDYVDKTSFTLTNPATIEAWVRATDNSGEQGVIDTNPNTAGALRIDSPDGWATIETNVPGDTFSSATLPSNFLNNWHHVARTFEAGTVKTYLDGALIASNTYTTTPVATTLVVGTDNTTNWFTGGIDDVRVYNYARTAKQIVSDLNASHPSVGSPVGSAMGYWKLDEGQGTTAHNSGSLGSLLDGTISNAASPATSTSGWSNAGKFGKSFIFDNDNDIINMGSDNTIDNIPALSVSAWIKPHSSGENSVGRIIDKTNGANTVGWTLILDNNNLNFSVNYATSPLTVITSATIPQDTWSYVTVTWDGSASSSGVSIYINGKKQTSFIQNDSPSGTRNDDASASLYLGNVSGLTRTFDGTIDEVKLYNYVLNQQEVTVDMNQGRSQVLGAGSTASDGTSLDNSSSRSYCVPGDTTSCSAPLAEWNFDEGTGTTAKDTTGNAHTLAGQSSPTWAVGKIGSAIGLDGSASYYCSDTDNNGTCDSDTNLQITGDMTINFWANTATISDNTRMIHEGDNTENQIDNTLYALYWKTTSGNDIEYTHENGSGVNNTVTFDTNLSANTWYYFTLVRDTTAKQVSLYVNGKLISTSSYTSNPDGGSGGKFAIGTQYGAGGYLNGKVDMVRLYNYKRTVSQIAWDYNRGEAMGWWKFDECQGTTAYDASGNGNNGTITIGALGTYTAVGTCSSGTASHAWNGGTTGKYSSAMAFDSTDDYVSVGSNSLLTLNNGGSIEAWIKPNSAGENGFGRIIDKSTDTSGTTGYYLQMGNGTAVDFCINNSSCNLSSPAGSVPYGSWTHVIATFDGINWKLYLNGNLSASVANTTLPSATTGNVYIGNRADNTDRTFDGLIDNVRLYNYALTPLQVKTQYNQNSATRFGPSTGSP